jgi:hypothetical protein
MTASGRARYSASLSLPHACSAGQDAVVNPMYMCACSRTPRSEAATRFVPQIDFFTGPHAVENLDLIVVGGATSGAVSKLGQLYTWGQVKKVGESQVRNADWGDMLDVFLLDSRVSSLNAGFLLCAGQTISVPGPGRLAHPQHLLRKRVICHRCRRQQGAAQTMA